MVHSAIKTGHALLKNVKVISFEPGVREVMSCVERGHPAPEPKVNVGVVTLWTDNRVKEKGEHLCSLYTSRVMARDGDEA